MQTGARARAAFSPGVGVSAYMAWIGLGTGACISTAKFEAGEVRGQKGSPSEQDWNTKIGADEGFGAGGDTSEPRIYVATSSCTKNKSTWTLIPPFASFSRHM